VLPHLGDGPWDVVAWEEVGLDEVGASVVGLHLSAPLSGYVGGDFFV
jgi:hypothetical protein